MVNLRPVNHGNPNLLGNSKVCRIDGPLFWPIFSTKKYCWIYEVIDKREDWDKLDGLIFIFCAAALFFTNDTEFIHFNSNYHLGSLKKFSHQKLEMEKATKSVYV